MNKGEWSEFYTFLRLLGDGKLYAADANLNKIPALYYPLIKIIRHSKCFKEPSFYEIDNENIIINNENYNNLKKIPNDKFSVNANKLFKIIKDASCSSFEAPEIYDFITEIGSPLIKEKSSSKRDITVIIHDINTGYKPEVGFSIKSKLGGDSTLFNANITNNFKYRIEGLDNLNRDLIDSIRSLKAKELVKTLNLHKCTLVFESVIDSNFESNLHMVDSNFPIILAEMIRLYYSGYSKYIKDLICKVAETNPCGFKNNEIFPFYLYKVKGFLTACALGMTSKKPWNGNFDVLGGYIVVKENGDLLCYHIYNWNDFQEYLVNNTYIDTPSTTRHKFGYIEGNKLNLNFQIRFT
ncbi:MAG: HpaII family restriction endonuclease [Alphaproteobacteria bacterium]|nr:HpaII family restriction endonuclease [Alphaproteobacteria bacterium]OJV12264.1 MAG: hypothetical protein BGO27_05970 [Alphaproteobacteria bacterium 33-17]